MSNQSRLARYKPAEKSPQAIVPVSVIISARNEAKNLAENLPAILQQNYPDFEVVVVNDCSYDSSDTVLEDLQQTYPQLKVVTVTEHVRFKTGKKFALTLGIKAAKNEHLLFTDADCIPCSDDWITHMASNFDGPIEIVLGYSPYKSITGILNAFIRLKP